MQSLMLVDDLSILTVLSTNQSILPRDLETANAVLSNTIDTLSTILGQNGTSNLPEVREYSVDITSETFSLTTTNIDNNTVYKLIPAALME